MLLQKYCDILEKKNRNGKKRKKKTKKSKKARYYSRNRCNKNKESLLNDSLDDFYCRLERAE